MATLYIVATPIGNREDLSFRALRVLKEVSLILCEDTRVARKLLDFYQCATPLASYHQHSGSVPLQKAGAILESGKDVAFISDAGTPAIADPGGRLVADLRARFGDDLQIVPVPGANAALALLSVAGISADKFLFYGFLPHKKGRQTALKEISASNYPVVVYESKHRILKLLSELNPELNLIVGRELTKMHESLYFGSPPEILTKLQEDPLSQKGEFVLVICPTT